MHYVISDIHGCQEEFTSLLRKISFDPQKDVLIILGDILDKGPNSLALLLDLADQPWVIPLMGNHDYFAFHFLEDLYHGQATDLDLTGFPKDHDLTFEGWLAHGGKPVLKEWQNLRRKEQQQVLAFGRRFIPSLELKLGPNTFVLVHAGLADFKPDKPLEDYTLSDLIGHRADYQKKYYEDKYLVTGHTPFFKIHGKDEPYQAFNHLTTDGGCVFGHALYALCLEDLSYERVEASPKTKARARA